MLTPPKWVAAAAASLAIWDWVGLVGTELVSFHVPASSLLGLLGWVPLDPHCVVPLATPWQYCVVELAQELPPTPPKKSWT